MSEHAQEQATEEPKTETVMEGLIAHTGCEVYMRANLTHNSKSTNIDTTAYVKCASPDLMVKFFGAGPEGVLEAALQSAFDVSLREATRRGKPVAAVLQPDGFAEVPPLSELPELPF